MSVNGFTMVGQCGKPMKNGNTQLVFLERLPRDLLNELVSHLKYNTIIL